MIIRPSVAQKDLARRLETLLQQNNVEQYLHEVLAAFKGALGQLQNAALIYLFCELENRFQNYRQVHFRLLYTNFFTALRDSFFIPQLWSYGLELDYIQLSNLLTESGIRLPQSPAGQEMKNKILTEWRQSGPRLGIVQIIKVFLLDCLIGIPLSQAKIDFIKRFADIPGYFVFNASFGIAELKAIFNRLFSSRDEIIKIFEQHVFAAEFFQKETLAQKACLFWFVTVFASIIYEMDAVWLSIYPRFKEIFFWAIENDQTELAFSMHYPLSHLYGNLTQTQEELRKFNEEIDQPFCEYIIHRLIPRYQLKPAQKRQVVKQVHIGFVYDRLVRNSPFMVLYSVLKALTEFNDGRYKFFVYDIECVDKSPSDPDCVAG
ncbi:MAG: hypothetical protein HQK55_09920, partial [Deltaproteobacteria bacterium]|nr:hypothetical protein [Deltaproteobacteria bacterium]